MEGPLPGDVGKRVVVLHNGQATQCSHCLLRAGYGCSAMGMGRACKMAGTPRAKMTDYMQGLRSNLGYISMKIRHIEKQARMFPSLIGLPGEKSSEQEIEGAWAMEEDAPKLTAEILNPIEERDKTIMEQNKVIDDLRDAQFETASITVELEKMKADNLKMKKKIEFTKKCTEDRIMENISDKDGYRDEPFLVALLSTTLDEDDLDLENLGESLVKSERFSRKDHFVLSSLESIIDQSDELLLERISHVKNQVLEKIKLTKRRQSSTSLKRRQSLLGTEDSQRPLSRARTASPPNLQHGDVQQ